MKSFHQARRNCQDAGGNVGTIQFADLRANAQSVGGCQNGASHMLLARAGEGLPRPTSEDTQGGGRA